MDSGNEKQYQLENTKGSAVLRPGGRNFPLLGTETVHSVLFFNNCKFKLRLDSITTKGLWS